MQIEEISAKYDVKLLREENIQQVHQLRKGNEYCYNLMKSEATIERLRNDMRCRRTREPTINTISDFIKAARWL